MFETLETRRLLSAFLTDGRLSVGGTDGDDVIRVSQRGAFVMVREAARGGGRRAVVSRSPAADVLSVNVSGDEGHDRIDCRGLRLPAAVYGHGGNDTLLGGRGNDTLSGAEGNDVLHGYAGNDVLDDDFGDDRLVGGAGDDALTDRAGTNTLDGGADADTAARVEGQSSLRRIETATALPATTTVQPNPNAVSVVFTNAGASWAANVTMYYPYSGHTVTFDSIERSSNRFTLTVTQEKAWDDTVDALRTKQETYDLGALPGGAYEFVITTAEGVVKTVPFLIPIA